LSAVGLTLAADPKEQKFVGSYFQKITRLAVDPTPPDKPAPAMSPT
jgi:hypothetical protein